MQHQHALPLENWNTGTASGVARATWPEVRVVGVVLAMAGTPLVATSAFIEPNMYYTHEESTSSVSADRALQLDLADEQRESTRRVVNELRRLSGLTWDQLAQMFSVSRRSLHFWASGRSLSAENEGRLLRTLDAVHQVYRGDAASTRTALLTPHYGVSAFELLSQGRDREAAALLGEGAPTKTTGSVPLSRSAQGDRKPLPPAALVGARDDIVPLEAGDSRIRISTKVKKRDNA